MALFIGNMKTNGVIMENHGAGNYIILPEGIITDVYLAVNFSEDCSKIAKNILKFMIHK